MQRIGAGAEVTLNLTAVAKQKAYRIEMDSLEVGIDVSTSTGRVLVLLPLQSMQQ
ncbi:MAG: hypothetical protein IPL35_04755 [Sphingobacteriales bacterium]|nr:hypothetical protein [Sphingobacteriales bacterium]